MAETKIMVYGTSWCGDCFRVRSYLNRNRIDYQWVYIDRDNAGEALVLRLNRGMRSVPTIIFPDGDVLVEPSTTELRCKLSSLA